MVNQQADHERPHQNGSVSNKDILQELHEIIRSWEEDQAVPTSDPTPHIIKLCDLFERETINFLKQDPDPFDDRHPVTSRPDCALGLILRAFFRKDSFVNKLVNHYLKDSYFTSMGIVKSSFDLNTSACRLLLDLLHGLDIPQVFRDSDSTVMRLYSWAEKADEPLRTYATGLLAAAMDISELATSFRDQNAHLIQIVLKNLWEGKIENYEEENPGETLPVSKREVIPERPFAHLSEQKESKEKKRKNISPEEKNHIAPKKSKNYTNGMESVISSPKNFESVSVENSVMNSDCSNSSWAEMSPYIVGTYKMSPMEKDTMDMFRLKYLRPVGEYQEALGHVYEHRALKLLFHYINPRTTNHARLSFEALRFLGSLLFHKKFCIEFVNIGGVQKLLQVPRPSLPADGVALCLWYLAYCEEAIERTCMLHDNVLSELVRYSLWLLECSHQSSRMHAVMFFGMVFKFRGILEKFDEQDGMRKMVNILSTLSIFQEENPEQEEVPEEPNVVMMWQIIKQVCNSIKSYFEAHLLIRVQQLQRISSLSSSSSTVSVSFQHSSTPVYKALNVSQESVERNNDYLLEHFPHKGRWKAVENFAGLRGINLLLKLVGQMVNVEPSLVNKNEVSVCALEIIQICCISPSAQNSLSAKLVVPKADDFLIDFEDPIVNTKEISGYKLLCENIMESTSMISSPEVQKAALLILINLLCAPVHRPGSPSQMNVSRVSSTPTSSKRKSSSSEDSIKKAWDSVRNGNGIMNLLGLLHKKVPITDADCIRGLACKALVGLSRSEEGRQIMSKLPIFASGELQLLMKEPILQDKRKEHIKFQSHAIQLIKAVSGGSKSENNSCVDVSIKSLHKASVVAQTRINYNKKQLLQLMSQYLVKEGYANVSSVLQKEANLPPLPLIPQSMGPPVRSSISTPPPSHQNIRNRFSNGSARGNYRNCSTPHPSNGIDHLPLTPIGSSNIGTTPISIKLNRPPKKILEIKTSSPIVNIDSPMDSSFQYSSIEKPVDGVGSFPPMSKANECSSISLDRIVVEYLTNQHALCENPVVTCPTFDLFVPHRCPDPKPNRTMHSNFVSRYTRQCYEVKSMRAKYTSANRKFIYSRYRPSQVFRPVDDEVFLTCDFTPDDQNILVGTTRGEIRMFNRYNDTVISHESVHQGYVSSLHPHKSNNLLLTSSAATHQSALWNIKDHFDNKFVLAGCHHAEFTHAQDKILGTLGENSALYDLTTGAIVQNFTPKICNGYNLNKAALDPSDELLLTDGVLFDVRSGKQLHKFDKINPLLNGIFHKNGLEIISSSEIWDLRTFHLLRTVPSIALCDVSFNNWGDVIFGLMISDDITENAYETSFKTLDATDYSNIATVDVRRVVSSLAINPADTHLAVVESDGMVDESLQENAVVRVYDIGMTKQEEEEDIEDDDDDIGSDEEDSDDSSQTSVDEQNDGENDDDRNSNRSDEEGSLYSDLSGDEDDLILSDASGSDFSYISDEGNEDEEEVEDNQDNNTEE